MKLTVQGLWHLGCVTAACTAQHHQVVGLDFNQNTITDLGQGKAPVFEPGLNELLAQGLGRKTLTFSADAKTACRGTDVLWLCYDTPVNEDDESDNGFVLTNLRQSLPHLPAGALEIKRGSGSTR